MKEVERFESVWEGISDMPEDGCGYTEQVSE